MTSYQPNQLVVPELQYRYVAGLDPYNTAMLKIWVVLVVEIAMEQARCAATQ